MDSICIVGGGIAGLTLAATLDQHRWRVTVCEQAPERRPAGTTLGMWPEVMPALDPIGVGETIRARGVPLTRMVLADGAGRPITEITSEAAHLVCRPTLFGALEAAVPDTVDRIRTKVEQPDLAGYHVVVGADGVHSAVRRTVFGRHSGAQRTGYFALRGLGRTPRSTVTEQWHQGHLCGLSPAEERTTNWYLSGRMTPDLIGLDEFDDETARSFALRTAEPFGHDAVEAVRATPADDLLRQEIWTTPARWRLVRGNAVLIGDAAHAMFPNLGRGACEAILDAATLGRALNELPIAAALANYQRERAVRTQLVRLGSRTAMRVACVRRGAGIRNALLRLGNRAA